MIHPWKKIIEEIRNRGWTQKQFAILVWKKNSEVNELIKWKRNITIQWDFLLSQVLWTPEKYWIDMQTDYDYEQMKLKINEEKNKIESFEIVEDVPSNNIQEVSNLDNKEKDNIEPWKEEDNEGNSMGTAVLPQNDQNELSWTDNIVSWAENKESTNNNKDSLIQTKKNKEIQNNSEFSEEERQRKKEMRNVFINF